MDLTAHYIIEKLGEALMTAENEISVLQARVAELEKDAEGQDKKQKLPTE